MRGIRDIEARLQASATLPDTLAACFDAFEIVRHLARDCEDRDPTLFAAFMSTADAALDGREAITVAPSLPPQGRSGTPASVRTADASADQVASALASLGAVLRGRLFDAAACSAIAGDMVACTTAAKAASRVCQLMARSSDDRCPR